MSTTVLSALNHSIHITSLYKLLIMLAHCSHFNYEETEAPKEIVNNLSKDPELKKWQSQDSNAGHLIPEHRHSSVGMMLTSASSKDPLTKWTATSFSSSFELWSLKC